MGLEKTSIEEFPFKAVSTPKKSNPFCVDGRDGKRYGEGQELTEVYPKMLGGSLNSVIVAGVLRTDESGKPLLATQNFIAVGKGVFGELRKAGFGLGLHTDKHSEHDKTKSGCGFADNLPIIINYLRETYADDIWTVLLEGGLGEDDDKGAWDEIISALKEVDLDNTPQGKEIIAELKKEEGVAIQNLNGGHREKAAIVNFDVGISLDTDQNQDYPAFNLDMWRVKNEARVLGIDPREAELLTLGLYVATEIALVEDRGQTRLPIIVHK
ncbi:MAG: hypothetical protein GXO93_07650 [FCB group bacterium]|nr:hypothetical protein [FCB group bacterium]